MVAARADELNQLVLRLQLLIFVELRNFAKCEHLAMLGFKNQRLFLDFKITGFFVTFFVKAVSYDQAALGEFRSVGKDVS